MDYLAMQSCTSGRNAFFTGMYPLRTGMIPPQLPGQPVLLATRAHRRSPVFLHDLGYTTGEFGKNHLGDHTASLPTAHGFQEYWGCLYHLDAMQQVSFPDINSSVAVQGIAPPCKNTPVPGLPESPRSSGSENHNVPDAPATGDLVPLLRRHGEEPDLPRRGPADIGPIARRWTRKSQPRSSTS